MNKIDTTPLRQLFDQLGVEPLYVMPSLAARQLQEHHPRQDLPKALTSSVARLRDLAVISRNYVQIGAFDFGAGLEFLQAGRTGEAVAYFESARRQWLFIDHLPLICLAHLGTGMAHHGAQEFRLAAAAYFSVKRCLQQAEEEPYRLEKIEAERSLQAFWNDLERWLMLAIESLRDDFDDDTEEHLLSDRGDIVHSSADPVVDNETAGNATTLNLIMRPGRAISAAEVDLLLLQTIEAIATLNEMIPPGEFDARPAPIVVGIMYNEQAELVIELSAVSPHVVALWRWLTKTIPADARSAGPYTEQPAGDRPGSPGEMRPGEDESPRPWFRLQVQPGQIAGMVKFYVKRTMGKALDARELEPLVRAIVHLAELRINCQLRLRQGAS